MEESTMSSQTISITKNEYTKLLQRVSELEKTVSDLMKKIKVSSTISLTEGSSMWWEKEEAEADEDIKKGKVFGPFSSADGLIMSLHDEARKLDK